MLELPILGPGMLCLPILGPLPMLGPTELLAIGAVMLGPPIAGFDMTLMLALGGIPPGPPDMPCEDDGPPPIPWGGPLDIPGGPPDIP